jgi:hypothetical protein
MITFEDCLPASYEVTFIPLVLAYVFFGLGLLLSFYIAIIGPLLYGVMCLFFLTADLLDGLSFRQLSAKVAFLFLCLSPVALTIAWRHFMG